MKRILIYVSDHGYGHAARTIALVRNLLKTTKFEIIVKNSNAFYFLKSSLPNVRVEKVQTDVGPVFNWDSNRVDLEQTFDNFSNWINNEETWISQEVASFRECPADLILTDISPIAVRLAQKVRCACITVGNFSWIDILKKLPYHKNKDVVLRWLDESFSIPEFAIKLPLSMNMEGFSKIKNASLLCRDVTCTKRQTLKELGLDSSPIVVYTGAQSPAWLKINKKDNRIPLVTMRFNELQLENKVFSGYSESQNIIAASKAVIAKSGYSILAECVKFRCPIYIIPRIDYPEDVALSNWAQDLGIGKVIDMHSESLDIPHEEQIKSTKYAIKEKLIESLERRQETASIILETV